MCICFVCTSSPFRLLVLSIRDELLDRPTSGAKWDGPILAGIDGTALGTWFGVNGKGRVGILLSITQPPEEHSKDAPSRGQIPMDFLSSSASAKSFCENLVPRAHVYNGFQFVALDRERSREHYDLYTVTNKLVPEVDIREYSPGSYVFGNSPPDLPFRKVLRGKTLLDQLVGGLSRESSVEEVITGLLDIGMDTTRCYPDSQLDSQAGASRAQFLSSIFVRFPPPIRYGTRCLSVLVIEKDGNATFHEKRLGDDSQWHSDTFKFIVPV